MKTEAKYRFVGIDDDAKTKSVNCQTPVLKRPTYINHSKLLGKGNTG